MGNLFESTRAMRENRAASGSVFRNENGAIDLASIMVGVIVIGLIGGVIAATIFAVIPWAQDAAAKHQLDSITQAENAYYGFTGANLSNLPAGAKANTYSSSPMIAQANLLIEASNYCVVASPDGKSFNSYSLSGTGKVWTKDNTNSPATVYSGSLADACPPSYTDPNSLNVPTPTATQNWPGEFPSTQSVGSGQKDTKDLSFSLPKPYNSYTVTWVDTLGGMNGGGSVVNTSTSTDSNGQPYWKYTIKPVTNWTAGKATVTANITDNTTNQTATKTWNIITPSGAAGSSDPMWNTVEPPVGQFVKFGVSPTDSTALTVTLATNGLDNYYNVGGSFAVAVQVTMYCQNAGGGNINGPYTIPGTAVLLNLPWGASQPGYNTGTGTVAKCQPGQVPYSASAQVPTENWWEGYGSHGYVTGLLPPVPNTLISTGATAATPSTSPSPSSTSTTPATTASLTLAQPSSTAPANSSGMASSSDGTILYDTNDVGGQNNGNIMRSTDSGATWTPLTQAGQRSWYGIATSADGQTILAVAWNDSVYLSKDGGVTWTSNPGTVTGSSDTNISYTPSLGTQTWTSAAVSRNGTYLVVADSANGSGHVWYSSDAGSTWTQHGSSDFRAVSVSDDGNTIAAASASLQKWDMTTNATTGTAANWAQQGPSVASKYTGVSVSGDGLTVFAGMADQYGSAVVGTRSTNNATTGFTYTMLGMGGNAPGVPQDAYHVVISQDGTKALAVGSSNHYVLTSTNLTSHPATTDPTWPNYPNVTDGGFSTAKFTKATPQSTGGQWWGLTMSADGSKVAFGSVNNTPVETGTLK